MARPRSIAEMQAEQDKAAAATAPGPGPTGRAFRNLADELRSQSSYGQIAAEHERFEEERRRKAQAAMAGEVSMEPPPAPPPAPPTLTQSIHGASDQAFSDGLALAQARDQKVRVQSPNAMHGPVMENIASHTAADAATAEALTDAQAVERQRSTDFAMFQDDVARKAHDTRIDMEAQELAHAETAEKSIANVEVANRALGEASAKLADMKVKNPKGIWAEKGNGLKIAAIIGSALGGFGGTNVLGMIQGAIDQEIDASKKAIDAQAGSVRAKQGEVNAARQLHSDIMAQVGDERVADLAVRQAYLTEAASEWDATQAELGIAQLGPQQLAQRAELAREIADNKLRMEQLAAANPAMFTRYVSAQGKHVGRFMDKAIDQSVKDHSALRSKAFDLEADDQKFDKEISAKAAADRKKLMRGEGGVYREAQAFARSTEEAQAVSKAVGDLLSQDDIAGYGFTASPIPDALSPGAKTTAAKLKIIRESLGRMQSGGAITEDELETFSDMIEGGTALGGESRLRENLAIVKDMIDARIGAHERALSPEARTFVRRNAALPDFEAEWSGGDPNAQVVTED